MSKYRLPVKITLVTSIFMFPSMFSEVFFLKFVKTLDSVIVLAVHQKKKSVFVKH